MGGVNRHASPVSVGGNTTHHRNYMQHFIARTHGVLRRVQTGTLLLFTSARVSQMRCSWGWQHLLRLTTVLGSRFRIWREFELDIGSFGRFGPF